MSQENRTAGPPHLLPPTALMLAFGTSGRSAETQRERLIWDMGKGSVLKGPQQSGGQSRTAPGTWYSLRTDRNSNNEKPEE